MLVHVTLTPPLWVSDWFPTYVPLHGETLCESTVSHNFSQVAGEGRVCRGLDPTSTQYCGFFLFLVWYQNSWNIMTANYHSIWSNQHLPVFLRLQCKTKLCFSATPHPSPPPPHSPPPTLQWEMSGSVTSFPIMICSIQLSDRSKNSLKSLRLIYH